MNQICFFGRKHKILIIKAKPTKLLEKQYFTSNYSNLWIYFVFADFLKVPYLQKNDF